MVKKYSTQTKYKSLLLIGFMIATMMVLFNTSSAQADVRIGGGQTSLAINPTFTVAIANKGIAMTAVSPATLLGEELSMPQTSGLINPATGVGTVIQRGGIRFVKGSKGVALSNSTIVRGSSNYVTARVDNNETVNVFSLSPGEVKRNGFNTSLLGMNVKLTTAGAAVLNSGLGLKKKNVFFKAGQTVGVLTTNTVPIQIQVRPGGQFRLAVDAGPQSKLATEGISVKPLRPATGSSSSELHFLATKGILAAETLKGNIAFKGGVQFKKGNTVVKFTAPVVKIGGAYTVKVRHGKKNLVLGNIDVAAMTKEINPNTRNILLRNIPLTLSSAAARTLNEAFSTNTFIRGDVIGSTAISFKAK